MKLKLATLLTFLPLALSINTALAMEEESPISEDSIYQKTSWDSSVLEVAVLPAGDISAEMTMKEFIPITSGKFNRASQLFDNTALANAANKGDLAGLKEILRLDPKHNVKIYDIDPKDNWRQDLDEEKRKGWIFKSLEQTRIA